MFQVLTRPIVVALTAVLMATVMATATGLPAAQAQTAAAAPITATTFTALAFADPAPVTAIRSWPAVDGVGLAWSPAGLGSYAVDRRSGTGAWQRIADRVNVSRYADTAAPASLASAYRITPIGVDGEFPAGAQETAPPHAP